MITTGIPVTVAIYQWVTKYAAEHSTWFDVSHADHALIQSLFSKPLSDISNDLDLVHAHDFLRWLSVMIVSFDGGIFSEDVQSFMDHGSSVSVTWANGISHAIDCNGWDRATRNAIDYIVKRAVSLNSFHANTQVGLASMYHYLVYYQQQLEAQVVLSRGVMAGPLDGLDSSLVFLVLSSVPVALLQSFYLALADVIPEELSFDGLSEPLPARDFFSKPVSDDMLVIDKVKMHYNLMFHASLDSEFRELLSKTTDEFFLRIQGDPSVWSIVQKEMTLICDEQFVPRLSLLSMVLDVFHWPK